MNKKVVPLVILVSEEDADAILFNDQHGNNQSVHDIGDSYPILSAETVEEYLESLES